MRKLMRAKVHRATVTRCDPDYVGSITVDADLLRAADIRPNEAVDVLDIDNAVRISTYAIPGQAGGGAIEINGAAARLFEPGHKVIVIAYGYAVDDPEQLDRHVATVVLAGEGNTVADVLRYPSRLEGQAVGV